ncbi:MAG TPA: AI-2E family transporter [Acidothermaceae bacterium]|nr:AI-2E family transporter [Acidothermaceae bacterium]
MSTGPLITPTAGVSASAEAAIAATKASGPPPAQTVLPRWLVTAGAWSWRLIALGIVGYFLLKFILRIQVVVLPILAALVFTALLRPLMMFFQRHGLSRLLSTWVAFLIALLVILGIGTLVVYRATVEWHTLVKDLSATSEKVRHWLSTGPLHLKNQSLADLQQKAVAQLNQHRGAIVNTVVSGAGVAAEFAAGLVLTAFITFFFLYDGEGIWRFVAAPFRSRTAERVDRAALAAWTTLSGYIRGSVIIATFHGLIMGITLSILGVPLVAPLTLVVFITSFVPLIGVLVGGGLAVFVTMGTQGVTPGLILLGVLVVEHQLEGHFLQPIIMGRSVSLHPLAIALTLTVGSILEGVVGAIVAVPLAAMLHAAWPHLRESELMVAPDEPPPPGHVLID